MSIRAVRGAVQLDRDDRDELFMKVSELFTEILLRNKLGDDDLISVLLTATPDLRCGFPAAAVRELGFSDVPLMCAQEINIDGALPRTVRVLVHADTACTREEIVHVYLGGAATLRRDLAPQ